MAEKNTGTTRRPMTDAEMDAYKLGIRAAASLVEMFDQYVNHPWRLSDCVLGKFNLLPKSKIRRKPKPPKEARNG